MRSSFYRKSVRGGYFFVRAGLFTCLFASSLAYSEAIRFNVVDYGANGSDTLDDTDFISKAIEAAAANGGGEVYFPTGTYVVSPRGTAQVSVFEKRDGAWILLSDSIVAGDSVNGWSFGNSGPVVASGEHYLNLRDGKVYRNSDSGWAFEAFLVAEKGQGWTAGFDSPDATVGVNGDFYLKYHVDLDNLNGAVFELNPSHNNITFLGDGSGRSIIDFKTWSGQDPMDYVVDVPSEKILYSAIPRNAAGRIMRGSLFVMKHKGVRENYDNIHWDGLQMRGNTSSNGKHGWYNAYNDLEEWDISNKCIVFTFGGVDLTNISVKNCSLNGWRGEILYKGGKRNAEILIENCDIFESNGSAVSISGNVILRDCQLWDVYNGVENYSLDGQFTEIYDSTFDIRKGDFGIVYLGTENAHLKVENCTITNARKSCIFLSDFANNVTIRNNVISNSPRGIYTIYLKQYEEPIGFDNILIEGNLIQASTRDMDCAFRSIITDGKANNWYFRGNTVEGLNGYKINSVIGDNYTGSRSTHDFTVEDNVINGVRMFDGKGLVPVFRNNTYNDPFHEKITYFRSDSGPEKTYALTSPHYTIGFVNLDGFRLHVDELWRYPVGHKVVIQGNGGAAGPELVPAEWNSFSRGYMLSGDAFIEIVMGEDQRFHLVQYEYPSDNDAYLVSSGSLMAADGRTSLVLAPKQLTTYDSFSGIPVNVPVTITVNENVRFANNAVIETPDGSTFDPDESQPLIILKDERGVLTFPGFDADGPAMIIEPAHFWSFDYTEEGAYPDYGQSPLPIATDQAVSSTSSFGGANSGLRFSGDHKGYLIPDSPTINTGEQALYTISLWLRPDENSLSNTSLVFEQGGYWRGLNLILDRGFIRAGGWNRPADESDWQGTQLDGGLLLVNEWNHIALVLMANDNLSPGTLSLYVNGQLADAGLGDHIWSQYDANGIGQVQGTTVYLGRQIRKLHPLQAELDDLTIWQHALSADEITQLILDSVSL